MTPTSLALALTATTSAFLPIAGQPNDDDLVRINNALAPILQKVTYDRTQGAQNLWGLIADANRYLHHYGLAFVRPAARPAVYDPAIAEGASRVERTRAEAAWAALIQDYEAYEAAEAGIKTFIETVVEDTWIRDLRDPETFYSNVTALALLNHLRDRSGGLHALDMVSLSIQMNQYYEGTPIIPEYIQLLEDAQRKAARASLPVTDQSLVMLASTALLAADTFPRTTEHWEELPQADKTWPAWKAAYLQAHQKRANRLRATGGADNLGRANQATFGIFDPGASGIHLRNNAPGAQANQAANFLGSIDNALDNLASAAANNKAVLEQLVTTNSFLTTSNSLLANQIKCLQAQLAAKRGQVGGGGGGGNGGGTTKKGPDPAGYCWSHGWRVGFGHNSSTCEHPKEGHQTNATRQNTKGGSSANKDWIPRTIA
jgi:hypothetical protein